MRAAVASATPAAASERAAHAGHRRPRDPRDAGESPQAEPHRNLHRVAGIPPRRRGAAAAPESTQYRLVPTAPMVRIRDAARAAAARAARAARIAGPVTDSPSFES